MKWSIFFLPFCILLLLQPTFAQERVATDFDLDGLSDFVWVENSDAGLQWRALLSASQTTSELGTFGTLGSHLTLADWQGTGAPQISLVVADGSDLIWKLSAGSVAVDQTFGTGGATVISGADFNGDGKADAATATRSGARWHFTVRLAMFSNAAEVATEFNFGRRVDAFFFANPDGTGDWIGSLRRRSRSSFLIKMRNVLTGEMRRFSGTGSFGIGRPKPKPIPIRKENGVDALVLAKETNGSTVLSFFDLESSSGRETTVAETGTLVVGNFAALAGEEVALVNTNETNIYNLFSGETFAAAGIAGIPVDEININLTEGDGGTTPPPNTTPPDSTPPTTPPDAGLAAVCASYTTIQNGQMLIKSEISDHINKGDPRATGYTLVCGTQCTKNLRRSDFFYANGAYAGSVGYYGRFSGNGQPRLYGAAGGAAQHFAAQIAAIAKTIGNGKLYMQVSAATTGAETACKEFNPVGRNGDV